MSSDDRGAGHYAEGKLNFASQLTVARDTIRTLSDKLAEKDAEIERLSTEYGVTQIYLARADAKLAAAEALIGKLEGALKSCYERLDHSVEEGVCDCAVCNALAALEAYRRGKG
jgi:uncharacterized coiled-coil protein SlyX